MKISRPWLQTFFSAEGGPASGGDKELPDAQTLAESLTFHAFEIESVENDILDVKVTPNRGHDCLCHRGIAKEISAILKIPMKIDPLRQTIDLSPKTDLVRVDMQRPGLCKRYIAGYIKGVRVGPSPEWLRKNLESIGQRSVNNVVDATNFVMFAIGQPLHAFDAGALAERDGYSIVVRAAREGEAMTALDGKKYELNDSMLVIVDANHDAPIGIAGVKGGMPAAITEQTVDIILESANFDGVSVRRAAHALKLRTDASTRFEQGISSELASYGMHAAAELIVQLTGGELAGFVDEYPEKPQQRRVSVSVDKVNRVLGTSLKHAEVEEVFRRLDFAFSKDAILGEANQTFTVTAPFERLDLAIPEDLIEEIGRILGYDSVPSVLLPAISKKPEINARFYAAEKMREDLLAKGYSEVYTSVFADSGERVVLNKVDGVRPYLRASLVENLKDAYEKNMRNKDVLGLAQVRLFEIGTVWKKGKECTMVGTADEKGIREEVLEDIATPTSYETFPLSNAQRYQPFSKYPFIVRDVALWVPAGTKPEDVLEIIRAHAGDLLVRCSLFDQFEKNDKTSYAFRLVFQSFDKTLTDFDANERMGSISAALSAKGYEIR